MIPDDQADDQTRAALHAVADVPAPPAVTTVEQVMRKGRRRAYFQRSATVAAVVGVVAAIGVGGVMLRAATEGEGVRPAGPSSTAPPASTTTALPTTPAVPTTDVTLLAPEARTKEPPPDARQVLLPGWVWVEAPVTESGGFCTGGTNDGPVPQLGLPNRVDVTDEFLTLINKQTGTKPAVVAESWADDDPKTQAPRGYLEVNVDMGDGPGAVQLEVGRFGGTPEDAADADVANYGNCPRPSRLTRPDGTVLQLYQPDARTPALPMQHLAVYLPNGRQYIVTTAGYGESDKTPVIGDGSYTVTSGRGRLPLGDAGLAAVAAGLANIG